MSVETFSMLWAGVNLVFILGLMIYIIPKFRKILLSIPEEPVIAVVTKSEMTGKNNVATNMLFQFEYEVGEQLIQNVPDTYNMHDFKAFVSRYPVGSELEVWISKLNPHFAMLKKPSTLSIFVKMLIPYVIAWGLANFGMLKIGANT